MFKTVEDTGFTRVVDTAILTYTSVLKELTYIEHGSDNIVAMANKEFVFRFPRNEKAARRIVLETALLQKIKDRIKSVSIPQLLEVHPRPLYIVTRYIEGDHLTGQEIQSLTDEEQHDIGQKIAEFMYEFNQAVSGLEVRRLRTEASVEGVDETWPIYFQRLFETTLLPNDKLRPIVDKYYNTWKEYVRQEQSNYTIHDDLNPNNLLFVGPKLSGVLDFGDTNVGSIESELRKLYPMGDKVLKSAVERYESVANVRIEYDNIRVWAIMQELARFVDKLRKQETETFFFKQAQQNLRAWVTGFPL